jgi:hypothetical protein
VWIADPLSSDVRADGYCRFARLARVSGPGAVPEDHVVVNGRIPRSVYTLKTHQLLATANARRLASVSGRDNEGMWSAAGTSCAVIGRCSSGADGEAPVVTGQTGCCCGAVRAATSATVEAVSGKVPRCEMSMRTYPRS